MKCRSIVSLASVASMAATSFVLAHGASAQEAVPVPEDKDMVPVCMTRPLSDTPQVAAERRGQPFRIVTFERAAPGLEAKGFARVDCVTADLVQLDKRQGWRNEICELAAFGNEAVQNQLEDAMGERPAVLCAGVEAIVGAWERGASTLVVRKPPEAVDQ